MSAIGKAIGPLVNIALLLLFAIIIFAIIGLEFYAGALNSTCYSLEDLGRLRILHFLSSFIWWLVSYFIVLRIWQVGLSNEDEGYRKDIFAWKICFFKNEEEKDKVTAQLPRFCFGN